ncbi:hypothetical protein [Flavobacterium sp. RS13.1]
MKFMSYTPEIRYLFKEKYNVFYAERYISFDRYELQK